MSTTLVIHSHAVLEWLRHNSGGVAYGIVWFVPAVIAMMQGRRASYTGHELINVQNSARFDIAAAKYDVAVLWWVVASAGLCGAWLMLRLPGNAGELSIVFAGARDYCMIVSVGMILEARRSEISAHGHAEWET